MSGSQPKSQVYLKFELIRVPVGCQNSHKTIKQEPYTDSPKKKKKEKTRATHTTKTEGTRRIVSIKTEEEEEEEEEEKRSNWIKQEEG